MKFRSLTNNETSSLTQPSVNSLILLGEEASSNRVELYFENKKNLLKTHFEQKNKQQQNKSKQRSPFIKSTYQHQYPKTAPARLEKHSNLLREVTALQSNSAHQSKSIRFSTREKLIMDWAFKRFEMLETGQEELMKREKLKKKKKTRFDHEFWFEKDEEFLNGAPLNAHINLNDDANEKDNFDFYRTNKTVTTKIDIDINRIIKQHDNKLIKLSKERYKTLGGLDYEKKKFVTNQLIKSESLPGLRCAALLNENPNFKFKKQPISSFDSHPQQNLGETNEEEHKDTLLVANNNLINSSNSITDNNFNNETLNKMNKQTQMDLSKLITFNKNDDSLKKSKKIPFDLDKITTNNNNNNNESLSKVKLEPLNQSTSNSTTNRPKTATKNKSTHTTTAVPTSISNEPIKTELTNENIESKESFETNKSNVVKKSILKQSQQPNDSHITLNKPTHKSIKFEDKTETNKHNQPEKQENVSSIEIMMTAGNTNENDDNESVNSVTSINLVDDNIITAINDQTLAANIKLVNQFDQDLIVDQQTNQNKSDSFIIKIRQTNVSSLSEPNSKLNDQNYNKLQRSSTDDINLNNTNIKLRNLKQINQTLKKNNQPILEQKPDISLIEKSNQSDYLVHTNNNNAIISQLNNNYFISPIQDNRFRDLISIVKPAFITKEIKDIKKIIEKNDALKSINIDSEIREKMNKVKERGSKLAQRARQYIASGEY
jgi:hypothetical protein